ncbi:MAG: septal ring lytic transglycosylase RlpA family protein [Candidatus Sedimenticola endophacoides]
MTPRRAAIALPLLLAALLGACSVTPPRIIDRHISDGRPEPRLDPNRIADAVPRNEPRSRRGNPDSYVVLGRRYHVMESSQGFVERGIASWYGTKFHGRLTSSGEPYDMYAMTAAHKSLPLPTYVEVIILNNGRRAVVKVNDRGPFHGNRVIDLSYAAATKLGIIGEGTGLVEVRAINPGQPRPYRVANPPPPPPVNTDPDIFLQVGAFSNRYNADRLRNELAASINRAIRIQESINQGRPVFRVQVGPLDTIAQVDHLTLTLDRMGIRESRVIIE